MVVPNVDPRLVAGHIVNTVRDGLADRIIREVMYQRALRRAGRLPFSSAILEIADQLLLLCVHGDDGLLAPQVPGGGRIDMLELFVAIGMRESLARLLHCLQAV